MLTAVKGPSSLFWKAAHVLANTSPDVLILLLPLVHVTSAAELPPARHGNDAITLGQR